MCINGFDHHCVFFSKCIGGGNISYFFGSIAGLVFNVILIAVLCLADVDQQRFVNKAKAEVQDAENKLFSQQGQGHAAAVPLVGGGDELYDDENMDNGDEA